MTKKYSLHNTNNIKKAQEDRDFLGELLFSNKDLIWFTIHRYIGNPSMLAVANGMEKNDVFQVGCYGFMKAIDTFDTKRGVLFTSYAPTVIIREIQNYLRNKGKLIRLTRTAHNTLIKTQSYLEDKYYNYLPVEEIAEITGESKEKIIDVTSANNVSSLYTPLKMQESNKQLYLVDTIADETDYEQNVIENIYLDELLKTIRSKLDELENDVLTEKLKGLTQKQIAENKNISKMRVNRILKKVRKIIEKENLN